MDLAQTILQELISLQRKNEDFARIIGKLEHESDIIIQQFEQKIEELKKTLKAEQDNKARASRRYEAEIRDLEGSRDALINEIAQVRETYQARIQELETGAASLTRISEEWKQQYLGLREEAEHETARLNGALLTLQDEYATLKGTTDAEIASLTGQISSLSETIEAERSRLSGLLTRKEGDIRKVREEMKRTALRLRASEDHSQELETRLQGTIDHLNHLIHAERRIRERELKERDALVSEHERELREAGNRLTRVLSDLATEQAARISEQEESSLRISVLEEENHTLNSSLSRLNGEYADTVQSLEDRIRFLGEAHQEELLGRDQDLATVRREMVARVAAHEAVLADRDQEAEKLSLRLATLGDEISALHKSLESAREENEAISRDIRAAGVRLEEERDARIAERAALQAELNKTRDIHRQGMQQSEEILHQTRRERDELEIQNHALEEYYRGEVAGLHDEIELVQAGGRDREDTLVRDISVRDAQIADLSTNNEALRAEIERIRVRYIRLQEAVRAEKDESVHALYRDIAALEDQVSGKNAEIADLNRKILRLDEENTRLVQTASRVADADTISSPRIDPVVPPGEPVPLPASLQDPRRRDVFLLAADLEDSSRAPEAAEKLVRMGSDVVDILIPLLHTGSIQRRVWLAVILYEINDNRATLPLMKLLETPKFHFRELIWEAKKEYRTRRKTGEGTPQPASLQAGPTFPGSGA